tara:strand:+ start:1679 stop:2032 length:354 start_codon:yes stop_codon:yes gene_type:complete
MENSVLNIYPENIYVSKKMYEYNFTFLNNIYNIDVVPYYSLILSRELYKLKNLYNYLYLRLLKIHRKYPRIPTLEINKYIKSHKEFNDVIEKYILKNKLLTLIIMNSIQQFYIPLFN